MDYTSSSMDENMVKKKKRLLLRKEVKVFKDGEIDLMSIVTILISQVKAIVLAGLIGLVIGVIVAFTWPNEYESKVILLPEAPDSASKISGLGSLSSLAGINLGSIAESGLNPAVYSQFITSTPFMYDLMYSKFYFDNVKDSLTVKEYFTEEQEVSLLGWILGAPYILWSHLSPSSDESLGSSRDIGYYYLTKEEGKLANKLGKRINAEMDWDIGILEISVKMQDPVAAAQIANFTQKYIKRKVVDYNIKKAKENYLFIEEQYARLREEFHKAQSKLALFNDKNKNVVTSRSQIEEERLKQQYNTAYQVYTSLASQLEQAKLQLNESTPVFHTIEPATINIEEVEPSKLKILLAFIFMAVLVAISSMLIRNMLD